MKNRIAASAVAVSVAVTGGVVSAPVSGATAWTDGFNSCVATAKAVTAYYGDSPDFAKQWELGKAQGGVAGSSAPGDAFSFCMEAALKDPSNSAAAGPAAGILLAIIAGTLGLAGGVAWFLDQQGIVDLPL